MSRIVVTGASGFLGAALRPALAAAGHEVTTHGHASGPPEPGLFDAADAVIHLAGEPVSGRWTREKRRRIRDSRGAGTRRVVEAMGAAAPRPRTLISASAIGWYGDRGDMILDEGASPGEGFLAEVCADWEAAAAEAANADTRVIHLRIGIVLGAGGGALAAMLSPARAGLGGPMGSGRQWWSWIHVNDVVGLILHGLAHPTLQGPVNATAPEPERQRDLARALGAALGRPAILPAPAFALRAMVGGFASELLSSRRVLPAAATAAGYRFRFPDLAAAFADLLP
jgi:uncharacterized protein (TIGR01777 family)